MDYAKYHCSLAGMSSEAIDVLNEVMCMLLQKPLEHLSRLMEAKQGKYTELDWYILQMIKLNVTSDTSPYRHKYKPIPVDENVDWRRLSPMIVLTVPSISGNVCRISGIWSTC